jgi:hypothetical protein
MHPPLFVLKCFRVFDSHAKTIQVTLLQEGCQMRLGQLVRNCVKYCKMQIKEPLNKIGSMSTFCSQLDRTTILRGESFSSPTESSRRLVTSVGLRSQLA